MEKLRTSLENLHNKLINTKRIDEDSREMLRELMYDIRKILDNTGEERAKGTHGIMERLKEAAQKFEVTHPELAGAINIVLNSFSNIGV